MTLKEICTSVVFLCLFAGCSNTIHEISADDLVLRGSFKINGSDTIFDGPVKYYNRDGSLVEISEFKADKRNGKTTKYFPNGKVELESTFTDDYKNGQEVVYDSTGRVVQKAHYWYGLKAGSEIFYKNGSVSGYKFLSLENIPLYKAEYSSERGFLESGTLLYYVTNYSYEDLFKSINVFMYRMAPPGKELTYKLFDRDSTTNDTTLVKVIKSDSLPEFVSFDIDIPRQHHMYFFEVMAYYPSSNRTVKNILRPEESKFVMPLR